MCKIKNTNRHDDRTQMAEIGAEQHAAKVPGFFFRLNKVC